MAVGCWGKLKKKMKKKMERKKKRKIDRKKQNRKIEKGIQIRGKEEWKINGKMYL